MVTAMTMEWSKSGLSGAELERKRREYIEAAMRMSRRAETGLEQETEEAAVMSAVQTERLPAPTEMTAEAAADAEPMPAPAEMSAEMPEILVPPELLHEPETLAENAQKEEAEAEKEETSFGVFDVGELIEAVKKGEVDGEKLREASEILEEMSGKTEEMQRLAKHSGAADGGEPKSLNQSVRRHNGGSCPRCGQGNRNGPRG